MEARIWPISGLIALAVCLQSTILFGASTRTANFIIEAPTQEQAEEIGKMAEQYRHDLAISWIGAPMPNWTRPCPIHADVAPNLGAGGATSFVFDHGDVFDWDMHIQGSEERVLDSVLPHEVTHTIFASYFRRPLPRWADEGACTTVEHSSERSKQQVLLVRFLQTDHGIAFDKLFAMKEYPHDVMPLYSEGYSLARYLIEQGGRQKFISFVGEGMKSDNWPAATKKFYGFSNLQGLQDQWLAWVKQGSPTLVAQQSSTPSAARNGQSSDAPVYRAQSDDRGFGGGNSPKSSSTSMNDSQRGPIALGSAPGNLANDQGWEPTSAAGHSVYDVHQAMATKSSSTAGQAVERQPEFVAQRDSMLSSTDGEHRVLLQWTR
jgi:hypothetical protein